MSMRRRRRVFISFDDTDEDLKDHFIEQTERENVQISIVDMSLTEALPQHEWVAEANRRIQGCDVFMVIMGLNAHQAPGVLREVSIARGLNKPRFQLKPRRRYGSTVQDAGPVVRWRWRNLEPWFTIDAGRMNR